MASTVVTHVIMFIAVISIATGLLVAIKNYADQSEGAFAQKSKEYNQVIKTSIKIDLVHHDSGTNTTWVYVRNTGQTSMYPDDIEIYLDGARIARGNRTVELVEDAELVSPEVWDPKELLLIKVVKYLNSAAAHEAVVTTPYQVRDTESFSI